MIRTEPKNPAPAKKAKGRGKGPPAAPNPPSPPSPPPAPPSDVGRAKAAAPAKRKRKKSPPLKSASTKTVKPGTVKTSPQDRTGDRKLDVERVVAALRKSGGLRTLAAQELGVGRTTLYAFLGENAEAIAAIKDIDEEVLDIGEAQVLKLLRSGDPQTVRWFMEMKGKERGYVRRVENVGKGGGPMEVAQKPDLSNMTDEELEILLRAAEKREQSGGK